MTSKEEIFIAIILLHKLYLSRYGNLNKELQDGSYVGREKYPKTSGRVYEFMVHKSGRYQSIGNGDDEGGRGNSNCHGNQHNQRQNIMFLQQDINGGNSNCCPTEDQFVPGKYGSTWSLEFYYYHKWGHILNNYLQITPDWVCGGGGGLDGGAHTGGIYGTEMLQIPVDFDQNTDGMIPSSWILLDTCFTSSVWNIN